MRSFFEARGNISIVIDANESILLLLFTTFLSGEECAQKLRSRALSQTRIVIVKRDSQVMADETDIDSLFREHSLKEIEAVRDNLASEIQKKTELLKSIVKEKYRDIVETSDAIKLMKLNLMQVEKSLWNLGENITDFYSKVRESQQNGSSRKNSLEHDEKPAVASFCQEDQIAEDLVEKMSSMWCSFDSGDLKNAVTHLNDLTTMVEFNRVVIDNSCNPILKNLEMTSLRAKTMIKNHLWHKIKTAAPDQICIIGGSDQIELYNLSLSCSLEFSVHKLLKSLSDLSYHAQIRRYLPQAYFNRQTNQVEACPTDPKLVNASHVAIPRQVSPELSAFMFEVCEMINKIAGFNLNRDSIVHSLKMTIEQILLVYSRVAPLVDDLKGETKRKRALQLHYDLLFVRILLNTSKEVELIERYDPEVDELSRKYELMLDSIEYYVISSALHENVKALSRSTARLYGLLIPHLH